MLGFFRNITKRSRRKGSIDQERNECSEKKQKSSSFKGSTHSRSRISISKVVHVRSCALSSSETTTTQTVSDKEDADTSTTSFQKIRYLNLNRLFNDYTIIDGLGVGGFGVVVKVQRKSCQGIYAMKVISKKRIQKKSQKLQLQLEIETISSLSSPFLLKIYDTLEIENSICLIFEYISGGDLFYHLSQRVSADGKKGGLKPDETVIILAELCLALEHMHSKGFIHRDVKIENIMLDSNGHVKLIDFGLSVHLGYYDELQPMKPVGSYIYMAPELLNDKIGGRCTDWWAYGVVAYELISGFSPWSSLTDKNIIVYEVLRCPVTPPDNISFPAKFFISSLLTIDFRFRLGTLSDHHIKQSDYFALIDWQQMMNLQSLPAFIPPLDVNCISKQQQLEAMIAFDEVMNLSIKTEHDFNDSFINEKAASVQESNIH